MASTKGRVADAAHDCISSFDAIAQINTPESESSKTATRWSQNEDGRSRFQIWMSNLGAAHPATDRRSADYRLREAPEVVDRIVELLEELTEINSEALEIISGERSNRHISEEDSDTESSSPGNGQDELSELFLSTGDVLTSLFKVSMLVKKATTRDRYARAASAKDKSYLVEFDIRHVADKYPKAREQPWLLERLGAAITQRRQYLRYCRNHKNRIAHVHSSETAILGQDEDALRPLRRDGKLEIPAHNTHLASSTKTRPTLSPTTASTLQPDKIVREDLQDLDDNDDVVSQSTSVAYSQATGDGNGYMRVMRLQDLSHNHEPFECPYCFSIVQARRQRSWRKHVLSDLRAYVCMFEDCDAGLFEDKAAWALHDAEEHRRQWDCQHCRNTDRPFSSSHGLHEHLRYLHAGHELPTEVLTQVVRASSRPLKETAPECPLCDFDIEVHRQADRTGQAIPSGSQAVIPLAELQKHLALHQEQLALFAIPPAIERGVESESRHGKSQVGPDEQNKMMADWQDHLSELDAADDARQFLDSEPDSNLVEDSTEEFPTSLVQPHSSTTSPVELPGIDTALYNPQEGDSSSISPGDIVYISRLTEEQLIYTKAVYLGEIRDGQHIARDWNTKNDLKVSLSELIRKENVTEDEMVEAKSIKAYVAMQDSETLSKSRFYLKHATLSPEIKLPFMARIRKLAAGDELLSGYDRATVQTTCSAFWSEVGPQLLNRNVRVEELVRMFYTSAVSDLAKDTESSDDSRKADVERHAALLTDVLIGVIDETSEEIFPERDIVSAQLREEQAGMISRVNRTVSDAKDRSSAVSGEHAERATQETEALPASLDHLRNTTLPLGVMSTLIMKASKLGSGHEMFVGYDEATVRITFSSFRREYGTKVLDRSVRVKDIVHMFYASAKSDLSKDKTLSASVRTNLVERHAALLMEVLIGIIDQVTERYFPDRNIVSAQLREEQADMMSRANQASRDAKSAVTSGEHDSRTREERLKEVELSPQSVESLKSQLALFIEGNETAVTLPEFGAHPMRQTCSSFLSGLQSMELPAHQAIPLEVILDMFYACAKTVIRQERATQHVESRSVSAERLVALLLSLLISVDANLEFERLNGSQPRIRGQFTALLMKERSRCLSQASEIEERLFRVSQRSKPEFDIHFFTDQSRRAHDKRYGEMMTGGEDGPTDPDDPSESKYCYCLRSSHGVMVACDGPNCRRKWFHISCTDLKKPLGDYNTWFCIFCQPPISKATEGTQEVTDAAIVDEGDTEPEPNETREPGETAKERPPRGMVCNKCKFVWRSALALELRDCPNCGSYSVFAESAPRTTSPEATDSTLRPGATGEEAMGKYFSERTDKFMSLYRRETPAESKSELPRADFPDPWSHLHTSSSANSTRLEESPPALPKASLPDFGTSDNTTGDGSAPVADSGLSARQLRRTLDQIDHAMFVLYDEVHHNANGNFTGIIEIRDMEDELLEFDSIMRRLLQRQGHNTKLRTKLKGSGGIISTLCSSIQNTLEDMLIAIASNDATQWKDTIRMMEDVELVTWRQRFKLYRDLLTNLMDARGRDSDYWLKRLDADVLELLGSQENNSSQAARRKSHRSAIWPSESNYPQIPEVPIEDGLDGPLKLSRRGEEETAVSEDPASASHDRGRESRKESTVVSAGSANRRPHRRPEWTLHAGSEEEENDGEKTNLSEGPARASSHRGQSGDKESAITPAESANRQPMQPNQTVPGLSRLPSIRYTETYAISADPEDKEYAAREFSRENARRQKVGAEAVRPRHEDLEAAETRQLLVDLRAERARNQTFDSLLDDEPSSRSRHTSPPAPPRLLNPTSARGKRSGSIELQPTSSRSSRRRSGTYGRTTVHQFHKPDGAPTVHQYHHPDDPLVTNSDNSNRRPSDSIGERGRPLVMDSDNSSRRPSESPIRTQRFDPVQAETEAARRQENWESEDVQVEGGETASGREPHHVSEEPPAGQEYRSKHRFWWEE